MNSAYGNLPTNLIISNLDDLIGKIFKLLPYKEDHNEDLDYYFSTLLFRLTGLSNILNHDPELITVISVLEAASKENNFHLYRKAILDSCSTLKKLQEKYNA